MISSRRNRVALPTCLATALALAACASRDTGIPSLAPRPIEKLSTAEPVAPATAPAAADPALAARYAAIVADAEAGDEGFQQALAAARPAAARARGSAAGSDAWVDAQQSLTRLAALRDPVGKALAALDAERTSGVFDAAPLDAAVARVAAIDARERAAVDTLAAALPDG